jgi:hypothetical protein
MDIGARPKQLNLLSIDDTSDEMERPSTPADRSRLPASTVDREDNIDDIDDLIDATPSGEVQMRVKGGLNIGRSGTPMRDSRAEIDTERLTKELAEHGGRKEDIGFIGESILRRKSTCNLWRGRWYCK